jgi:ABC-type dipeptide/oligopeptide/nickel transport system ATPase component
LQKPSLLIADEPTTALDVTVQAEILKLLVTRARDERTAILLITHNLGLVWNYCDSVIVMQNGAIVESGRARATLAAPTHQYTKNLLGALPGSVPPRTPLIVAKEASA